MNKAFNLLDEPWLPVRMYDGSVREVGLLEAFARATEITALAETAPPSLVAEYRLLLAITHRALTLAFDTWKDKDRARWYREGLPVDALQGYLEREREHFWLFHPERPFLQVAALAAAEETRDKWKPWTQIALGCAIGNAPVVFDHSCDTSPTAVSPALALRALLGFLQFSPGGLVKVFRDADKAGALANTAAVIPLGLSLSESLCLALHPASASAAEDLPCWEQEGVTIAQLQASPRMATGPNDRYTRQSRAVLLHQEDQGQVRWLRFGAGVALEEDANAPDPMASYRAGANTLVRLTFSEGRALWRDLPALLPDATGQLAQPAAVMSYASNLQALLQAGCVHQPVLVAGLASDQAKLLRWRAERVVLPLPLLVDADRAAQLRDMVREAEELQQQIVNLATTMWADTLPDSASKDTRARAREMVRSGPAPILFFSGVERSLGVAMNLLADDRPDEAEETWRTTLSKAAQAAWQAVCAGMGQSIAALRAEARYSPRFRNLLRKSVPNVTNLAAVKET